MSALLRHAAHDADIPLVEVNDIYRCVSTMKCNKSPGHDGIMAFLDASKAFDKVLLNASVLWNGIYGRIFPILCGVRQGGVLSPILFSIYVDDLIQHLRQSGCGAHVGRLFVGSIMYADDIA